MWQLTWRLKDGRIEKSSPTSNKKQVEWLVRIFNKSNPSMVHEMTEVEDIEPDTNSGITSNTSA